MSSVTSCLANLYRRIRLSIPKIYLFRFPKRLSSPAILLFPIDPRILRCGLAAIIEYRRQPPGQLQLQELRQRLQSQFQSGELATIDPDLVDTIENQTLLRSDYLFCALAKDREQQSWLQDIANEIHSIIQRHENHWQTDERQNAILVRLRDIVWRIEKEHLANLAAIVALAQKPLNEISPRFIKIFRRLNSILNIINRLEIRGRDSTGISVILSMSGDNYRAFLQALATGDHQQEFAQRRQLVDLVNGTIRHYDDQQIQRLTFVFKVCSEIGKLGDNVAKMRAMLQQDRLFYLALEYSDDVISYLAHTRWASNGIINIFNCHPLDNELVKQQCQQAIYAISPFQGEHPHYRRNGHIFVVLNGDIDNYEELKIQAEREHQATISSCITTDAKMIAVAIQQQVLRGLPLPEAFRQAVLQFTGSHAIAMHSDLEPGTTFLALKGSGQAIYIGLAEDRYVVASEVYGLVEDSDLYLAMDGETPRVAGCPETQGQIFILDNRYEGLAGIRACYYDGTPLPLNAEMLRRAEITTRDIDRSHFTHFFAKEIHQAPQSIFNTIKGKFLLEQGQARFLLAGIIPEVIDQRLRQKQITKIYVVGQGTASIAAYAVAYRMEQSLPDHIQVRGLKSSELSGFYLRPDMHDTLVLAITQSGTTTDTNRAVDMAKTRGAATMAIVNRRNSHVTTMVDGVFYTSDGRDIEMAVASTKAFYSQVTAGEILTLALAQMAASLPASEICRRLESLLKLPGLLKLLLTQEQEIAAIAARLAPRYQHWALVGSGANSIAAEEVRIKLSELCYKSIACDYVEDKKHIDLSAEPLILVCAAGTPGNVLGDVIKDVAIFKAHNSAPVVIVHENESRFQPYAAAIITVPAADELSSLILNTMAGHLFGYHAACSIDNQAIFFATLRSRLLNTLTIPGDNVFNDPQAQPVVQRFCKEFHHRRRLGLFNSSLSPSTCADIALLLSHVCRKAPWRQVAEEFGIAEDSNNLLDLFLEKINRAIDELSRSVDAIKHQAKTVTVGTSRQETVPEGLVFATIAEAGLPVTAIREDIIWRIKQLQPAIASILGYSYYEIAGLDATGQPTDQSVIHLLKRGGISQQLHSRSAEKMVPLVGTKRTVAQQGEIFIGIGMGDQRPIMILPIFTEQGIISHQLLVHLEFAERISATKAKTLLGAAYDEVRNTVVEANVSWEDGLLLLPSPKALCVRSARAIAREIIKKTAQTADRTA